MASDRSGPFEGCRPYRPAPPSPPGYQVTARRGHSSGRGSTTTPPPGLNRKTKKPLLFISEKPSFFFSRSGSFGPSNAEIHSLRASISPRRFVRVMLQRVHHEKYICFPAGLPSKTAEGRLVDLLQPFVSLAWQHPLCQWKCGGASPLPTPRGLSQFY